jgi:Tol biopolymer transport system component
MNPRRIAISLFPTLFLIATAAPLLAADPTWSIYTMKVDGSQVRKIAHVDGHTDHTSPRWSHDDMQIVFDAAGGAGGQREFFLVNADGTGLRPLGFQGRADWSPDDKQLGFESGGEILVQNLDGQGREKIASGYCARWSPDGSQLAVNDRHQLTVIDLASGEQRALFDTPFASIFGGYNWSPDGKWLALSARPKSGAPRQLVLVNSAGQDQGLVVRFEAEQGGSISFSPDGKQLVFDNGYQLYTLEVAGTSPPKPIPNQQGQNKDPHWSHDGRSILFSSDRP